MSTLQGKSPLKAAAIVPGLPHLLKPELNAGYKQLAAATEALGDSFKARGVERIVYFSTQWISVLGHLYQAKADLQGLHVDENWYEIADLPFAFKVDQPFAKKLAATATEAGYQTKLVDYDGFPVDTGTIVADRLLNKGRFKTNMVSCCVYSDYADTVKLFGTVRKALDQEGKEGKDGVPTALVCVSMLSGRFFTTDIDAREDHIADPKDDQWNKRVLDTLTAGKWDEAERLLPEYAGACKVDMGLKVLAVLRGIGALQPGGKAKSHAYGAIHGTGAAVIEF